MATAPHERIVSLIDKLNEDLSREYAHMHFYLNAGVNIRGLHREEIGEFLLKEARSEMDHCEEFAKVILGLGGIPTTNIAPYKPLSNVYDILNEVVRIETEVVEQFTNRISQIEDLMDDPSFKFVSIFLEDMILDSRKTVDHVSMMLG
jgi:bacterioferritin (cytochrome b1)